MIAFVLPGGRRVVPATPLCSSAQIDRAAADVLRLSTLLRPELYPHQTDGIRHREPTIWAPTSRKWLAWLRGGGR